MFMSHASHKNGERIVEGSRERDDHADYQTVEKIIEMMADDHSFCHTKDDTFKTRDFVLLYKKMDLDKNITSNAKEFKRIIPNQHVESVVHEDHESDSDLSEVLSSDDLHKVVLINNECIDLLSSSSSLPHTLCKKFGEITFPYPNVNYNRQFLFKDLYNIAEQNSLYKEYGGSLLPATLLDYMCNKRLEDNHNIYMENVIKYVRNTIDQLKRISNGDYLTEKAKELWKEVENKINSEEFRDDQKNNQALISSTTIPLYVERNENGHATSWKDILHSELDIRTLSKMLEKQIVIGVPKSICGSYRPNNKHYSDDLIIRCTKEKKANQERLDVILKLRRSESGYLRSNIRSILFLQKPLDNEPCVGLLPLPSNDHKSMHPVSHELSIKSQNIQKNILNEDDNFDKIEKAEECSTENVLENCALDTFQAVKPICDLDNGCDEPDAEPTKLKPNECSINSCVENICSPGGDCLTTGNVNIGKVFYQKSECSTNISEDNMPLLYEYDTKILDKPVSHSEQTQCYQGNDPGYMTYPFDWEPPNRLPHVDAVYHAMPADDLRITMQLLNKQDSLIEDPGEDSSPSRRSPVRNRIKSPYENQSYIIEEKKRKRLLEIRQRREKKKFALTENSMLHVSKTKYRRSSLTPQTSSSVTKLSISNKSFYNTIYGHNVLTETKPRSRTQERKLIKDFIPEHDMAAGSKFEGSTPIQKYVKSKYGFKEATTEIMNINLKKKSVDEQNSSLFSQNTTPALSNNTHDNSNIISHIITSKQDDQIDTEIDSLFFNYNDAKAKESISNKNLNICKHLNTDNKLTSKRDNIEADIKKRATPVDFRKSIDKIYDLINTKTKFNNKSEYLNAAAESCPIPDSDSGTSFNHRVSSSDPNNSNYHLKVKDVTAHNSKYYQIKKTGRHSSVIPKVFISSKLQNGTERYNIKNEHNKRRDPLNTMSQLVFEFDDIQTTKSKNVEKNNTFEAPNQKTSPVSLKKTRASKYTKDVDPLHGDNRDRSPRKQKHIHTVEPIKLSQLKLQTEDTHGEKISKKLQLSDMDEEKEAKGEAVRGPSRLMNSRLNSLAQPKKHYVKAHFEEYQERHGRNNLTYRLQRKAAPSSPLQIRGKGTDKKKQKIDKQNEAPPPPSEKSVRFPPVIMVPIQEQLLSKHSNGGPILKKKTGSHGLPQPITPKDLLKRSMMNAGSSASVSSPDLHDSNAVLEDSAKIPKKKNMISNAIVKSKMLPNLPEYTNGQSHLLSPQTQVEYFSSSLDFESDFRVGGTSTCSVKSYNSFTTITNLTQRISDTGSYQKSSIKNLRNSTHHVMLLQSGDTNSIVVKTTASRELKINQSDPNTISELKALSELQKSSFDWTFTQMPMQITAVGCSFPQYAGDPEFCSRVANNNANFTCNIDKPLSRLSLECLLTCENGLTKDFKSSTDSMPGEPDPTSINLHKLNQTDNHPNSYPTDAGAGYACTCVCNNSNTNKPKRDLGLKIKASEVMSVIAESDTMVQCDYVSKTILENILDNNEHAEEPLYNKQISEGDATKYEPTEKHDQKVEPCPSEMSEDNIVCTSSLDMLVGLLNEIKNITTCQTELTNDTSSRDESCDEEHESTKNKSTAFSDNCAHYTDPTHSCDVISITSRDNLKQMDSNPSIYSYIRSIETFDICNQLSTFTVWPSQPIYVDKEVSVQLPDRELVSKCTDVPSTSFIPVAANDASSALIFRSAINVISEPTNWLLLSSTLMKDKEIVELKSPAIKSLQSASEVERDGMNSEPIIEEVSKLKPRRATHFRKERNSKLSNLDKCSKLVPETYYTKGGDFDRVMKIKRDVLVTVYSILVFTVFAALSWPRVVGL